jgi:hypothetical protein
MMARFVMPGLDPGIHLLRPFQVVMPGLDPGIHLLRETFLRRSMDCRVKPGNDGGWIGV